MAFEGIAKLPFWRTLLEAHRGVAEAEAAFWRHALLWLFIWLALDAVINWFYWPEDDNAGEFAAASGLYLLASATLWIVVGGFVGVPLHRWLLRDSIVGDGSLPAAARPPTFARYIARNAFIAAMAFLLFACLAVVVSTYIGSSFAQSAPAVLLADSDATDVVASLEWNAGSTAGSRAVRFVLIVGTLVLMTPLFALLLYIPTRLCLALPATAIDSPRQSFKFAWFASRGSFWRLFWGGLLSYWPVLVVGGAEFALIGVESQSQVYYVLSQSVATATNFFAGLIWVAFFSLAYRHLVMDAERNVEADGE